MKILIIKYIKVSATTIFTFKLIFIWSWFETIYTHLLNICVRLPSINFRKSGSKWDLVCDGVVIFIHYKMVNLDSITNVNNKKHSEKWPYIPDYLYRIIIVGGSGSGKTNALINLIYEQNDINKIYLYARDLNESKYKYLIKQREDAGIKHLNNPNAFIECSNTMDDIHDYNSSRRRRSLIVFDDIIADIMDNKKFQPIIKELFIRCRN